MVIRFVIPWTAGVWRVHIAIYGWSAASIILTLLFDVCLHIGNVVYVYDT